MLYDQGQLLQCFVEAIQLTSSSDAELTRELKATVKGIIDYLERDLSHPEGALYAAEDADSLPTPSDDHAKEGAFYVWQASEVEEVLGKETPELKVAMAQWNIKLDGNIDPRSDPHGDLVGMNMLHGTASIDTIAVQLGLSRDEAAAHLEEARRKIFSRRLQRPRPQRDDKVITAWNFLAISGLCKASEVLSAEEGGQRALEMAKRAAAFVLSKMWDGKVLHRSWRENKLGPEGFDVDYAFAVQG